MDKLLPFSFLIAFFSFFGIAWIIFDTDPDTSKYYIYILLVFLIFLLLWNFLGLIFYLFMIRINRRVDPAKYVFSSYKISLLIATFVSVFAILAILKLISTLNIALVVLSLVCFVIYNYLGKKIKKGN